MLDFLEKPSVLVVLVLLIVVFGAKRLPDSARALGRSMRILKAEAKGLKDDDANPVPTTTTTAQVLPPASAPTPTPEQQQSQP